jgi:hypothetical protein
MEAKKRSAVLGYSVFVLYHTQRHFISLVGKPRGERPLLRLGCRWEDNIKMDLKEIRSEGMNRIHWAWDRVQWQALVDIMTNLWVL